MKTIHKKISLEQFKSRMPSIIPAYDENGVQHNFTHMVDLASQPLINYGMIPFDVQIDENEDYGQYSGKLYSYKQLVELFHTLDSYYEQSLTNECVEIKEMSNEDKNIYQWLSKKCFPFFVFDNEINTNINDIKTYWGVNKLSINEVITWMTYLDKLQQSSIEYLNGLTQYCCEHDEFNARGGTQMLSALKSWYASIIDVILCKKDDYGHDFKYTVKDSDTYVTVKVLKENNVTTHSFQIFEPRVKILGNNRYIKYGKIDSEGNVMNPQIIEIIDGILTIPCLNTRDDSYLIISEPSFILPLTLNNNITNIGQMTSICEPWEEGYEYNKFISNQDNIDYEGGVMVYYNNDNWVLKNYDYPGYIYSTKYKEVYFANVDGMTPQEKDLYEDNDENGNDFDSETNNDKQWERYFESLPKVNDISPKTFTYKNDKLVLNPTPLMMCDKYEINTNNMSGYCVINDIICPIFSCEYVEFNKQKYEVFYVYGKLKPYINVNEQKIFINTNNNCKYLDNVFKFDIKSGDCFYYGSTLELKNDHQKEWVEGYVQLNDKYVFFERNDKNIFIDKEENSVLGHWIKENEINNQSPNTVFYYTYNENEKVFLLKSYSYIIYDATKITGTTTSKISLLKDKINIAVDNLGNYLNGSLSSSIVNFGTWLNLPYVPKYTTDLEEIKKIDEKNTLYWGNIINSIKIIYDEINKDQKVTSALTATTSSELKNIESTIHENILNINNIQCYIEYYIGSYIIKNHNTDTYSIYYQDNDNTFFYGIRYVDVFSLIPKETQYFHNDRDYDILNYLDMIPQSQTYKNQTYNVNVTEPLSFFEYISKPFDLQYGYIDYDSDENIFYKVKEYDKYINNTPILFKGTQKYFEKTLNGSMSLHKQYSYYCVNDDIKYYVTYDNANSKFVLKINDIIYTSVNNSNIFEDDKGGQMPYNLVCEIPIKLYLITNEGSFNDEYFDYFNDMTVSPLIFNEKKLGFSTMEKISENIYIDRGTVRALDFHLRLMETKSLESLEQIGNGFFKFNDNN